MNIIIIVVTYFVSLVVNFFVHGVVSEYLSEEVY